MAYTSFPTLTDGQVLTGAHMQIVKANFDECPTAKVTASGQIVAATGANAMAARTPAVNSVATVDITTSTSYTALATAGPAIGPITTGALALICIFSRLTNSVGGNTSRAGCAVSGASSLAASDLTAVAYESSNANDNIWTTGAFVFVITPGSNTFTMQYRTDSATSSFGDRRLSVIPF